MERKQKIRGVWLVGTTHEKITGSKLPSIQQVLGRFFYLHVEKKDTIKNSATATALEVSKFWQNARIPTKHHCHIVTKIIKLYENWQSIKKSISRKTERQKCIEATFVEMLDNLFDVAHADCF